MISEIAFCVPYYIYFNMLVLLHANYISRLQFILIERNLVNNEPVMHSGIRNGNI